MTIEELLESQRGQDHCPILHTMDVICSKWKLPIIWQLLIEDGLHYNELKRRIEPVTNTMLTRSLRDLEKDGLVTRNSEGTVPPSVTYHLTESGKALLPAMKELFVWGQQHMAAF